MNRTQEVALQAERISLEQFIEASSTAVMRALDARRPADGIGLPTTTIGIIIRPSDADASERPQGLQPLRVAASQPDDVMATAMASAEMHNAFVRQVRERFAAAKGDRVAFASEALDRLHHKGLLSAVEAAQFKGLLQEAEKPQASERVIAEGVRRLNEQLRANVSSPLALTLAGVVAESPDAAVADPAKPGSRGKKAKACVSEGLVGAILGAELGVGGGSVVLPVVGTVSGAVVGAVVGGAVGCAAGIIATLL